MMEISPALRDKLIAEFREVEKINKLPKTDKVTRIPVFLDGVMDFVVYDPEEGRITELHVQIAKGERIPTGFGSGAWCDEWETVVIPL